MSIRIDTNIWIDRKPADVFAALTDTERWTTFMPGVVGAEQLSPDKGVGTRVRCSVASMGSNFDVVAEWTRYDQDEAIASKNVEGPMDSEMLTTLVAENGGTRLQRVLDLQPKGFLMTFATPMIKRRVTRDQENEFATLKDLLET